MLNTTKTSGKAIASKINQRAYAKLLTEALPAVITSKAQNRRACAIIDDLMSKKSLTPEEMQLLALLGRLCSDFERRAYPSDVEPREHLAALMEERGLKQADLLPVLGSRSAVSEILSGKRGISKAQAKKLAAFFNLPVEIFV